MRWVVALALLLTPQALAAAERYAIVVGANDGGPGKTRLWFAERDAARVARTLVDLGDFPASNVKLLQQTSVTGLRAAFAEVEGLAKKRAADERALFVFFYSGHAQASGLALGAERLSFQDLRRMVTGTSADVKVAIVDACDSGSLTQVKGARPEPAIDFALPPEDNVEGVAFLASTAVGESAQESAALRGSFFSHHLETALRGAADSDGDGQVTLSEAFRYTATRTVAATSSTWFGAQHPTFAVRTSGRGDVVLVDLRRTETKLVLPADAASVYLVRGPNDLTTELRGGSKPIALALPSGTYEVERRRDEKRLVGKVTLEPGVTRQLPPLETAEYQPTRTKGGEALWEPSVGVSARTSVLPNVGAVPGARVGLRYALGPVGLRLRFDYGQTDVTDESLHYSLRMVGGGLAVTKPLWDSLTRVEVGVDVGLDATRQSLDDGTHRSAQQWTLVGFASAGRIFGPVRVGVELGGGIAQVRVNDALRRSAVAQGIVFCAVPF